MNSIESNFVPYQIALDMKSIGFDEPCLGWWFTDEKMLIIEKSTKSTSENIVQAPLYQQAFKWFREKYDLFGVVEGKGYDHKKYYIYSINGKWHPSQPGFDKPEEAELACLNKLIEICKNEQ
jgi:hypothetical protein